MTTPVSSANQPAWYQDAVFYEVHVRSFFDANRDGIGDFAGLTSKLDYIQELGATCIWLLPFFPSPLRDDGYDVTDYRDIHPAHGTIADFREFLRAAHARGLRVVAEMVINHTSDQHPWFQAAREAPAGSPLREFYLWSETPDGFRDAEVLYRGANRRNWTWDSQAKAFYWHRFYEHQPDLNFGNEQVVEEVIKVLRFWADIGIDGLCLNGAAYLAEREGTSCEHLPETHALLKRLRRELQAAYPQLMLQAGVNSWPSDSRPYFGEGDECQMVPHLAIAQRMFLSVQQEDRHAIVDIVEQTPPLPPGCQWVTLLRNHDELTLRLATDEERDYLFREYAADSSMRLHSGILRRLAPLAENNRRRIELLFGLLFSLPGSPLIYYGDELGMGDNVFLGDRRSVRTPMQWSSDRNAGFSRADFSRLFRPPIMDVPFGYQSVNVESQRRDPSSLLHWMRRMIALRKNSRALSRGSIELLHPVNRKVLAFIRQSASDGDQGDNAPVLVVANLARTAQPVELDLSAFHGLFPVEAFGGSAFPVIGDTAYSFTLAPHSFFWFRLQHSAEDVASRLAPVPTEMVANLPTLQLSESREALFEGAACEALEREVLPGFLRSQRWFGGKARGLNGVRIVDWGPMPDGEAKTFLVILEVEFAEGARDTYFLPLGIAEGKRARVLLQSWPAWVLARLAGPQGEGVLFDALADDEFCASLLTAIGEGRELEMRGGRVRMTPTAAFPTLRGNNDDPLPVVRGPATSSNSLVFFGRRLLFKLFRRLEQGTNPDYEVGRYLTDDAHLSRVPQVAGAIEYRRSDERHFTLGIVQSLVANQGDGWRHAIDELGRYYERASSRMFGPDPILPDTRSLMELMNETPPATALETIGTYLHAAATLGRRTAELHLALARDTQNQDFAPEPLTADDMSTVREDIQHQGELALQAVAENLERLSPAVQPLARALLEQGRQAIERLLDARVDAPQADKTRIHGDYHLGQVLWAESDYVILDFEGEPARSVDDRRRKFSPIRDVAGMLRSYHYAAYAGLFAFTQGRPQDFSSLTAWAEVWQQWVSAAFLRSYLATVGDSRIVPRDSQELAALLNAFTLNKSLYELVYELNNRPDWVRIPLSGVATLLELVVNVSDETLSVQS